MDHRWWSLFRCLLDGEHQDEEKDGHASGCPGDLPDTSHQKEDGYGRRKAHSADDNDASDNDTERHLGQCSRRRVVYPSAGD